MNNTDKFVFNEEFKNEYIKIKINTIQLKETEEENTSTNEKVFLVCSDDDCFVALTIALTVLLGRIGNTKSTPPLCAR